MKFHASVLFWFRKNARKPEQPGTIMCRVQVKGKGEKNFSTGHAVPRARWDSAGQRVVSTGPDTDEATRRINRDLIKMQDELLDGHADLERQRKPVTAEAITRLYKSDGNSVLDMQQVCAAFLAERKALVGIDISPATQEIAEVRCAKLGKFLAAAKQSDLRPEEFTLSMGDKFLHWLLISERFQRNVANKYLQTVAQVLTWAVRRQHLAANPLAGYEYKMQAPKEISYLSSEELDTLSSFEFASDSLGRVRDYLLLQCWTGLAYADLAALNVAECVETHSGRRVLRVRRAKSTTFKGYECIIPLLPEAERILSHYKDKVPVVSNAYLNRALKQVGLMCGVLSGQPLTSHIGRKTAGVLFLNAGIPMEVVSKILGHSSVKQTEKVYAKILDNTVVNAIEKAFGTVPPPAPAPGFEPAEETGRVIQFRFGA